MQINFKDLKENDTSPTYTSSNGVIREIRSLPTVHLNRIVDKIERTTNEETRPTNYKHLKTEVMFRQVRLSPKIWVTKEKDVLFIEDMSDDHITNIFKILGALSDPKPQKYYEIKMELLKRGLIDN
jgi:hypothetical protein